MKNIKKILFLLVACLFNINVYAANEINKINMDIFINDDGSANVTETWDVNVSSGTEVYKPYYNLGDSEIKDFKVTFNEKQFDTIEWNTDKSFDEKAYKSGINYISDGVELCFGMSKYGKNEYVMTYTITNFVKSTTDADMVYWTLIPHNLSAKPQSVNIKIYSDFEYKDSLDVWGYGNYGGLAYVADGYISMIHEDELDSNEYMTILVKFPKGTFNTPSSLDSDFETYYNMAEEGATSYVSEDDESIWDLIAAFGEFIFIVLVAVLGVKGSNTFGTNNIKIPKEIKDFPKNDYFRDIPLNKDLFKAYWVAGEFKLIEKKTDFLGAILLSWIKKGNVLNTKVTKKNNKEERAIKLVNDNNLSDLEKQLYKMMYKASVDGVLESGEFTKWCKDNYKKILDWFNKVVDETTLEYEKLGKLTKEEKMLSTVYVATPILKEDAIQMTGLKNFLKDFSNIKDRMSIEVNIWDEYLMYAQIFGIAKEVAKEFKKLYPDLITDETYDDIIFIHTISSDGVRAANDARSKAESYSHGGGGFSSGGGGGGSFGGGGGGGGFR